MTRGLRSDQLRKRHFHLASLEMSAGGHKHWRVVSLDITSITMNTTGSVANNQ